VRGIYIQPHLPPCLPPPSDNEMSILLLGAGELGSAILTSLLAHPLYNGTTKTHPITLSLRPSTLSNPPPHRLGELASYRAASIALLGLDTETASVAELSAAFAGFETVIHAGGMYARAGTQRRVTEAVLEAGVKRYMPWQHGVDYDVLGPEAGGGLFAEQCGVRTLLRSQDATAWVVVGCGVFVSFLFEDFWGVVSRADSGGRLRVRALGSWDDGITATSVRDIGRTVAALVLEEEQEAQWREGHKVFIAGETLSYAQLADLVEKVSGEEVMRELWDQERFQQGMREEPEQKLWKYRAVFGGGEGVSWSEEGTWSHERGMKMTSIEDWMRENWKP
jgi:DNA-binding transcriptional regulator/RsmH inhibitor MraZ